MFYFYWIICLFFTISCAGNSELGRIKESKALSDQTDSEIFTNVIADKGADRYVCPMHAEVKSDRPGKCPKCGMTLKIIDTQGGDDAHRHH